MAAVVGLSLAWLWWSLLAGHLARAHPIDARDEGPRVDAEVLVLVSAVWLTLVGIASTLLAVFGAFDAGSVAIAAATGGLAVRLGSGRVRSGVRVDGRGLLLAGLMVAGGMALRLPPGDYALAGRDQGTYTLQAQHVLRTGGLRLRDPVLAEASRDVGTRSGPADLLGLYPIRGDAWAQDRYEGAYRPGFYLADRAHGIVVPQFFHLHPMLMATGGLVLGPSRVGWVIALQAALALLAVWTVARRLLGGAPWALFATGLVAASPLLVWVHRTALTEVLATVLLWSAVLAVLRSRDGGRDRGEELQLAGLLFGATAWLRGHAWIVAPIVAVLLWLVPPGDRSSRRGSVTYLAMVVAGVMVHAVSSYPYLHDELARQLPGELHPSPLQIVTGAIAGALVWWAIDERWGARRPLQRGAFVVARGPALLVLGLSLGLGAWALLRGGDITRPFSRLDPLPVVLGVPLAVVAAIGLARLARVRLAVTAPHAWLVGIGASIVVTTGLYAQRNLPQLQLYYYGRYLAPELCIAAALAAAYAVQGLTRVLARRRAIAIGGAVAIGGVLAWSVAGVLVTHPITRLREFEGAEAAVDHLAARLPQGAVVIAGGEGWHHGHTWNQVGGALALRTDATVLPYRTREAAYATMYELLVAKPAAQGQPPPPVFLLLNEATKPYTRRTEDGADVVAGIDDLLPPPFSATRIDLVELVVDRLTPTQHEIPTRVTRDGLRMGLFAVAVAPERWAQVERHRFGAVEGQPVGDGDVRIHGGRPRKGAACLHPTAQLVVELPPAAAGSPLGEGPVSIVLVSTPGSSADTHAWSIEIDGTAVDTELHGAPRRARDTIGPIAFSQRPGRVAIRGSARARKGATCPHGGLAELRVLGPDRSELERAPVTVTTLAPARDLGVPVRPASWVSARGLSRYRRGIAPAPEIHAVSMVLGTERDLAFSPEWMPGAADAPLDVIVTLTRSRAGADARLVVLMAGEPVLEVAPPAMLDRSWQSAVVTLPPPGPLARWSLRLVGAPDAEVEVRDVGLFSRTRPIYPATR